MMLRDLLVDDPVHLRAARRRYRDRFRSRDWKLRERRLGDDSNYQ
jgi:hypothetical protein